MTRIGRFGGWSVVFLAVLSFLVLSPGIPWAAEADRQQVLKEAEQEERRILAELEELEHNLSSLEDRLVETESGVEVIQEDLTKGGQELQKLEASLAKSKKHLSRRLRAVYRLKDDGVLPILLQAESVSDLTKRYRYLTLIMKQDREALEDYARQSETLAAHQHQLEGDRSQLLALRDDLRSEKQQLLSVRRKKTALLMKVHQKKELYLAMIRAEEESRQQLIKEVILVPEKKHANASPPQAEPAGEEEVQPSAPREWPDFAGLKGKIPRPVAGRVVSRFGGRKGAFDTYTNRQGWLFMVSPGAEIKAVLDGEVLYSGWMRGYGNIIIVHHGQRYYTLTGGLPGLKHQAGQWVRQGETLGRVPKGGGSTKKEIYFEIRHGGQALDPAAWMSRKTLT